GSGSRAGSFGSLWRPRDDRDDAARLGSACSPRSDFRAPARRPRPRVRWRSAAARSGPGSAATSIAPAAGDLEQALALYRDLSDQLGQADALTQPGAVRLQAGDHPGDTGDLEQALALYRSGRAR